MYNDITGIILSGGKSVRMGQNKSLLKINNETVIERALSLMKSNFKEVILLTN
jgi:molybdopterin-guanine dinucleotide biosynthesis protein A